MASAGLQNAPTLKEDKGPELQHLGLARPTRRKTHPSHTVILLDGETATHQPVTTEDLFTKPMERSHSEDLLRGEERDMRYAKQVNGIASPALPVGGVQLKPFKSERPQAGEKESVYQNGEPPKRPMEGPKKPDGTTCENECSYTCDKPKTSASDRPVEVNDALEDKRNGNKYEKVKEAIERESAGKPMQNEQKVEVFGDKSSKSAAKRQSSEVKALTSYKDTESTLKTNQGKENPSEEEAICELSDHENCNHADAPKCDLKLSNGVAPVSDCQNGKQASDEGRQKPATPAVKVESAGFGNDAHPSPSTLTSPKSKKRHSLFTQMGRKLRCKRHFHKNRKYSCHLNSNDGMQGPKSEAVPCVKSSGDYLLPMEKSKVSAEKPQPETMEIQNAVASVYEKSLEPNPPIPRRKKKTKPRKDSPTLLSIAESKVSTSGPSDAEAKHEEKMGRQNVKSSSETSTELIDRAENLYNGPRKGAPSNNGEMHELEDHEYCNDSDSPKGSFNGNYGAVPTHACQFEKHTPEENTKGTPNYNATKEIEGEEGKTQASLSPSPSSKPITASSLYSRSSYQNGKFSPRSDPGAMVANEINTLEGMSSSKPEIVTGIRASGEYPASSEAIKGNAGSALQYAHDNLGTAASTFEKSAACQPVVLERQKKANSEKDLSTPISMVHSEALAPRDQDADVNHRENEGQREPRNDHQSSPTHYYKAQTVRASHRKPVSWFGRLRRLSLQKTRSEELLLNLDDPQFASPNSLSDVSSSRSGHRKSILRKFGSFFKKEPKLTFNVDDPAEELCKQESGLQNEEVGVKSEDEGRTRSQTNSVKEVEAFSKA